MAPSRGGSNTPSGSGGCELTEAYPRDNVDSLQEQLTVTCAEVAHMERETLQTLVVSQSRRIEHLENQARVLEAQTRQHTAQNMRRNRQLSASFTQREEDLRCRLEQAELNLAAERSMRLEMEESTARLRELCKIVKQRLEDGLKEREKLQEGIERAEAVAELYRDQVCQLTLVREGLQDECAGLRCDLERAHFRQKQLEAALGRARDVAGLGVVAEIFETLCQRILNGPQPRKRKKKTQPGFMRQPSPIRASSNGSLSNDSLPVSESTQQLVQTVQQLIQNTFQVLPKPSVSLKDLTSLDCVTSLCGNSGRLIEQNDGIPHMHIQGVSSWTEGSHVLKKSANKEIGGDPCSLEEALLEGFPFPGDLSGDRRACWIKGREGEGCSVAADSTRASTATLHVWTPGNSTYNADDEVCTDELELLSHSEPPQETLLGTGTFVGNVDDGIQQATVTHSSDAVVDVLTMSSREQQSPAEDTKQYTSQSLCQSGEQYRKLTAFPCTSAETPPLTRQGNTEVPPSETAGVSPATPGSKKKKVTRHAPRRALRNRQSCPRDSNSLPKNECQAAFSSTKELASFAGKDLRGPVVLDNTCGYEFFSRNAPSSTQGPSACTGAASAPSNSCQPKPVRRVRSSAKVKTSSSSVLTRLKRQKGWSTGRLVEERYAVPKDAPPARRLVPPKALPSSTPVDSAHNAPKELLCQDSFATSIRTDSQRLNCAEAGHHISSPNFFFKGSQNKDSSASVAVTSLGEPSVVDICSAEMRPRKWFSSSSRTEVTTAPAFLEP